LGLATRVTSNDERIKTARNPRKGDWILSRA
jgi:hypothetical protein